MASCNFSLYYNKEKNCGFCPRHSGEKGNGGNCYLCGAMKLNSDIDLEVRKGLPVMEAFYTIQGEGYHAGKAGYFIRLGGCDVGCHWCDVKESWDAAKHPVMAIGELVSEAARHKGMVVVTGGEPLMWDLMGLTTQLRANGLKTHIETSGVYPLTGLWDWVCLSPKKNKPPLAEVYARADELKVIIHNRHDFVFAEEQAQKVREGCLLYLQPEWGRFEEMGKAVADYVMNHPQWRVSLQLHKYLHIP